MKKPKNNIIKIVLLILTISLLTSCSNKKSNRDELDSTSDYSMNENVSDSIEETQKGKLEIPTGDKIVSIYTINLETLEFEKTREKLDLLVKDSKGFIENSNIGFSGYEYSRNYRYGDFSIRIPKDNIDSFNQSIKNIGNITHEMTSKDDVTNYYRDTESRLNLITSKEKRLTELLEKAVKIEDIIAIESALTDTIYEKEMLEKDLKSIDEQIEYTTVNLQITEVRNFSNIEKSNASLGTRLKSAFKDSWFSFKSAIENLFVFLVFALPYLIVIVILVILVLLFIRKIRKKR